MADSKELREWVQTLSVAAVVVGAFVGVYQYKLSAKAEQRQRDSSRAEVDIRLSEAFAQLMQTANGRGASQLSEKCVEKLQDLQQLDRCIVSMPIGRAQQEAAIAAVGVLGGEYDVLRLPAIEGLTELIAGLKTSYPDVAAAAERALSRVESSAREKSQQ